MNSLISTLITFIITVIITIFSMIQIFGYTKLDKINGGYKYEVFNLANSSEKELKSVDYALKKLSDEIFTLTDDTCPVSFISHDPQIKYEPITCLFNKQGEDLNSSVALNFKPKLETFEPDTAIKFSDLPFILIIENDEGNNFHSEVSNMSYVKKTLNYHDMILNDKDGTKYIILRITYPTSVDKDTLVRLIAPVLNFVKKHLHLIFTTLLLSMSGYLLISIMKIRRRPLVVVNKEELQKYVDEDKESKIINKSNLFEIYNVCEDSKSHDVIKISYEDIVNDKFPPIVNESKKKTEGGNLLDDLDITTIMTECRKHSIDRLTNNDKNCVGPWYEELFGYMPNGKFHEFKYCIKHISEPDYLLDTNYNEQHPNFVISNYNFINYPDEEPVFNPNGYRTMFKQFVNNKLYKILKDENETYYDRLALLNSLILIYIQIYENWYACNDFGQEIFYPLVCHASDDFYDDLQVYELINTFKLYIIPEYIERIYNPSRIMCNEDVDTNGFNCHFKRLETDWVIPPVDDFNKLTNELKAL